MHATKRTTWFYLFLFLSFHAVFLGSSDARVLHSPPIPKLLRGLGFTDLVSRAEAMDRRSLASGDKVAPGGPDPQHHY
ncbi:hypothetical protein ACJRO7_001884 [Eucalyptus globulus]|uniref:Uncharacterized protein n=1 Tax=Eucalyptus globulus TaxID=34317 RepID=A0ABD3M2B0_EUCGL